MVVLIVLAELMAIY